MIPNTQKIMLKLKRCIFLTLPLMFKTFFKGMVGVWGIFLVIQLSSLAWEVVYCNYNHPDTISIMSAYAASFEEVSPPPELGETLTNYRTKKQLQEERLSRQRGLRGNGASRLRLLDHSTNQRLLNQIENNYNYTPNRMVLVYSRGETVLKFVNRLNGTPYKIRNVRLSSTKGFVASIASDASSVLVIPNGKAFNASLRVELEGRTRKVMFINLRFSTGKYEIRNIVQIKG